MHALLAGSALSLGAGFGSGVAAAALAAVCAHCVLRRPRSPQLVARHADGTWTVAGRALATGLALAPGTSWSTWYVALVLESGRGRRVRSLILRDQLEAEDWRRLQLAVREHEPPP